MTNEHSDDKVGILAASLLSGIVGYIVLNKALPKTEKDLKS